MKFFKSLYGGSVPLVRKAPWYDASTIIRGQSLTYGATTRGAVLIDSDAQGTDFIGVANETVDASTTALTTGTIVYGDTILDPLATYLAELDLTTTTDIDVVSATTTAITVGTSDDDLEGSWVYANSGTGVGQLVYIGAATTTVLTLDTTAAMTALDSTTDIVILRKPWKHAATSGVDLNSTFDKLLSDEDETGEFAILEQYVEGRVRPFEPLRPRRHHATTGWNNEGIVLSAEIYPTDHALRGATSWT